MFTDIWTIRLCFFSKFRGLRSFSAHICLRESNGLFDCHFILAVCNFGICHRLFAIWTLAKNFFVWFCGLCSFGFYMWWYGRDWWCRPHFNFTFCAFGFSLMLSDIWTVRRCIPFHFVVGVALLRTCNGMERIDCVGTIFFLRFVLSEFVLSILKFIL